MSKEMGKVNLVPSFYYVAVRVKVRSKWTGEAQSQEGVSMHWL